jgi:type IV pilus assembly protein PilC
VSVFGEFVGAFVPIAMDLKSVSVLVGSINLYCFVDCLFLRRSVLTMTAAWILLGGGPERPKSGALPRMMRPIDRAHANLSRVDRPNMLRFIVILFNIAHILIIFKKFRRGPASLGHDQLYRFTVNLELLLQSGIGITRALEVLSGADEEAFQEVCGLVSADVSSGHTLSNALTRQPKSFPLTYCRMIQTGELTGRIVACLRRISDSQQQELGLKRTLKKAVTYPAVLLLASLAMIGLILYFVFPMIIKVTSGAGVDPPAITKMVMNLSNPSVFWSIFLVVAVLGLALKLALSRPDWSPRIRYFYEAHTPLGRFFVLGKMILSLRQLAMMLECGTDLLKSIRLARRVAQDSFRVERAYADIEKKVRAGELLSDGFAAHNVFPKSLSAMVAVAEQLGETHSLIYHFCDIVEEQIQTKVTTISSTFEPILMGVMGFVIGTILLAAFLPVYQLVVL